MFTPLAHNLYNCNRVARRKYVPALSVVLFYQSQAAYKKRSTLKVISSILLRSKIVPVITNIKVKNTKYHRQ